MLRDNVNTNKEMRKRTFVDVGLTKVWKRESNYEGVARGRLRWSGFAAEKPLAWWSRRNDGQELGGERRDSSRDPRMFEHAA